MKVADCSFHSAVPEDVLRASMVVPTGASRDEEQARCEFLAYSTVVGESCSGEAPAATSRAIELREICFTLGFDVMDLNRLPLDHGPTLDRVHARRR